MMKKVFLLLTALSLYVVGVKADDWKPISNESELLNSKAYRLVNKLGYQLCYNEQNPDVLCSTSAYDYINTNFSKAAQWAVLKWYDEYFFLNLECMKFVCKNAKEGGVFALGEGDPVQIYPSKFNDAPFMFSTDNYGSVRHNRHGNEPGVFNWKGDDNSGGLRSPGEDTNAHQIVEVRDLTDEEQAKCNYMVALAALNSYTKWVRANYYDTESGEWKDKPGVNNYTGSEENPSLQECYDKAIETYESNKDKINSDDSDRTPLEDIARDYETFKKTVADLTINQPEEYRLYRLRCVGNDSYLSAKTLPYEWWTPSSVTRGEYFSMEHEYKEHPDQIFLLYNNHLVSWGHGRYIGPTNFMADKEYSHTPKPDDGEQVVFTAAKNAAGQYNIKINGEYIYGYTYIVQSSEELPTSQYDYSHNWVLEEVKELPVKINSSIGYASLFSPVQLGLKEGIRAYTVSDMSENSVTMVEQDNIAANVGVILELENVELLNENKCVLLPIEESTYDYQGLNNDNLLFGTYAGTIFRTDLWGGYVLSKPAGNEVGLYPAKVTDGKWYNNGFKAYIPIMPESEIQARGLTFDFGIETGINEVSDAMSDAGSLHDDATTYDLCGRRVTQPKSGLYISGGKVMIK